MMSKWPEEKEEEWMAPSEVHNCEPSGGVPVNGP